MEPLFFKAENLFGLIMAFGSNAASMEPLFFKAENTWIAAGKSLIFRLQWSRFFSKRKTLREA